MNKNLHKAIFILIASMTNMSFCMDETGNILVGEHRGYITFQNHTKYPIMLTLNGTPMVPDLDPHKTRRVNSAYIKSMTAKPQSYFFSQERTLDLATILANTEAQDATVDLVSGTFLGVKIGKVTYSGTSFKNRPKR